MFCFFDSFLYSNFAVVDDDVIVFASFWNSIIWILDFLDSNHFIVCFLLFMSLFCSTL